MINKRLASVGLLLVIASVISANSIEQQPRSSPTSDSSPHTPTLLESAQKEVQKQQQAEATPEAKKSEPAAAAVQPEARKVEEVKAAHDSDPAAASDPSKRKAKSADSAAAPAAAPEQKPAADEKDKAAAAAESTKAKSEAAKSTTKAASSQKQSSLSAKSGSGSGKSKLPANLGTVTSTGSGGATHYMSKHDAYSAIAEKHGALAHDAMRKSDKRHSMHSSGHGNPFASSIQKASGLGEMLNPFKGVTDSGLARTLGASMRSIMKSKYSVPAYVASALLGAVALMAFYESPISPLPVPALPNPPVGRFPPELPNISPNVQAPFRTNQQQYYGQNYNQRSLIGGGQQLPQQQQVFFPSSNQPAQQRQGSAGPVQNLAANLLASVAKPQQNAQRKSGIDYDPSTSRSLFGNNSPFAAPQKAMPAASNHQQRQSNAFLSFFGLGGGASDSAAHQMSGPIEPKGQGQAQAGGASSLSNSHLVNKVKSYFRAPPSAGSSSAAGISNSNPYDQYQRMSFVQALMKDTAFLPAFLSPGNRKSSSPVAPGSSAAAAKPADSAAVPAPANQQVAAAARMQVDSSNQLLSAKQQQPAKPSSGYGIVRVAHALLESLGSGIAQRSSNQQGERKSAANSDEQHQSLAAATSLLSDLVSGYTQANMDQHQQQVNQQQQHHLQPQQQPPQQQQQHHLQPQQQPPQQQQQAQPQQQQSPPQTSQAAPQPSGQQQPQGDAPQMQARSDDEPLIITAEDLQFTKKSEEKQQAPLVRKTRSIGLEYPVEAAQQIADQQPSRATQINNVIDFVADSYAQNRLLFNFMMNQVGLSQAVPYVEQILAPTTGKDHQ